MTDTDSYDLPGGDIGDEELMAEVCRGREPALRVLYDRHSTAMFRLLLRLTSSRPQAEEILQEVWLAVWQSACRFRGESSVRGWLLGVARRQAHNRLRRREFALAPLEEASHVPDPGADVEASVLSAAARETLADAITELPEHLREVVVLALVDELPYRDVAAVLGIPVGTVKSRMSHVRARLMRSLVERQESL
ncbi:RNA polymerase sigma factor [Actinomadura macra]|uniref:RNA polymerase sigma factor n=1 Tax=Actinomadura macra TaxID=46164 RepID=UPI00082CFD34|nr:RNA polymerase sigma factor [Actinomadura macra]